jgi:hypothetical protein
MFLLVPIDAGILYLCVDRAGKTFRAPYLDLKLELDLAAVTFGKAFMQCFSKVVGILDELPNIAQHGRDWPCQVSHDPTLTEEERRRAKIGIIERTKWRRLEG